MKLFVGIILCVVALAASEKARFDFYRLYSVSIENNFQLTTLQEIQKYPDGYNFWESPVGVGMNIDLVVPPHKFAEFSDLIEKLQLKTRIVTNNLQDIFDHEEQSMFMNGRARVDMNWNSYYRLADIYSWMDKMVATYPAASRILGGTSFEQRNILGVKISYKQGNPGVFIEAGIHAREWISPATTTYILNELLTSQDPAIRNIAENYDWYIFPSVNPDGYEYTHTHNRMWRKTRYPHTLACVGADPNRNWGFAWNQGGASNLPCSETYAGPRAFSEVETRTLSEYYKTLNNVSTYISFHSYGQMLLIPYGHTTAHLDNYNDLVAIGKKALSKLAESYGTKYRLGNIAETIYIASGGSIDWIKGDQRTNLTYCYELRDEGRYGFVLPAAQIIPTGIETLNSIVTMLAEGKALNYH